MPPKRSYWERRQRAVYLQHISALVHFIGRDATSIIDVGSFGCAYLDWFDWIPRKVSVDKRNPYRSETVEGITADFLAFDPPQRFDLCLCLQVLEHIRDAKPFAQKLLAVSPRVIISVPYLWPAGRVKSHVHDPVDEAKVVDWFGRAPTFRMISTEHSSGDRRLICYFDQRRRISFLPRAFHLWR